MPDGEITEKEGDRHRTDEHRCNKRRYVSRAEELDALCHEPARRQLHDALGYRHEDRGNRRVEPVHQLRDPERDHGSDHTDDPRTHPALCLLAHGGALQSIPLALRRSLLSLYLRPLPEPDKSLQVHYEFSVQTGSSSDLTHRLSFVTKLFTGDDGNE